MLFRRLVVGPLDVNCYLVADEEALEAVVVDPGGNAEDILDFLHDRSMKLKAIVNTHGHFDHTGANKSLKIATNAPIMIHVDEVPWLEILGKGAASWGFKFEPSPEPDRLLRDGDAISVGSHEMTVIHTPGHTPGGVCLLLGDQLITGDTLFAGGVGRTDLPGGDEAQLFRSIERRIFTLPETITIHPGHGPSSTIGREKRYNPFM